jgi:hypothetical protein
MVNAQQRISLEGLRSAQGHGTFRAAAYGPDGSLYLLLDEQDGVRVLRSDANGSQQLGQMQTGTTGDAGVAMALDPSGNVYVAGTTTSGQLAGTTGVAYPSVTDSSTNSFVAKYDANLNLQWLTFLGSGRTAVSSVFATTDSVFVTGITFNNAFPVTGAGIQQSPASGTSENGFVERFSAAGGIQYATYLTGVGGSTVPATIVADTWDNAYIAGATSASGFPTVNALQPRILLASGATNSGFLTKLNPSGSGFVFSTFIAGSGVTGMALDAGTNSLWLTGNVALGQFPVATVAMPLTSASYQTLLRVAEDGQSVPAGVLLTAGTQSFVAAGANGDAWVSGAVGTPLFPGFSQPNYSAGDSFLLHVTAANAIDQTLRFGGLAKNNASYAAMTSTVAAPAVSGTNVTVPGGVTVTMSSSLAGTERFDLPLVGAPTDVLPNSVRDLVPSAASCSTGSVCSGSGGLLAIVTTGTATSSLGLSVDDLPNITVRNAGSAAISGVAATATGYSQVNDCGLELDVSGQCSVALTGSGPGSLTLSGAGGVMATVALAGTSATADAIVLSTDEVDFGIVSAVSGTATRTVTVTNLSSVSQTFASVKDGGASATNYTLMESGSDCAAGNAAGTHTLVAGGSCHIALGLGVSSTANSDGPVRAAWKIGSRDVTVTGYAQAAALSVSASEVDFGLQIVGGVKLPRYLYLSNNSGGAVSHASVSVPTGSAFAVSDGCPPMLIAHSVCRMVLSYQASSSTSSDSAALTLDGGLSVLVTGETLPQTTVNASTTNPNLGLSVTSLTFATAVNVTGVSSGTQSVTLTNQGVAGLPLAIAGTGDFILTNGCQAVLSGGASCNVVVAFAPSQPGERDGLLSVTAGSGFAPAYVTLSGTGDAILPPNNGLLNVGQTLAGVPVVAWYKVQQQFPSLTVTSNDTGFGLALVEDTGSGHGTLSPSGFAQSVTSACSNCWFGLQYLSQTAGVRSAQLSLRSVGAGNAYVLTATAESSAVQGLVVTPETQTFGVVPVGSTSGVATIALTNLVSPAVNASVQSVTVSGDFAFVANASGGPSCAGTLAATASCYVQVVFSPTVAGERDGTLTVVTTSGSAMTALSGYGTTFGLASMGLNVNTNELTFAEVPGSSATVQTVMLTNAGANALTVGQVISSDPSFAVSTGCGSLSPGASCSIVVSFTPQSATVLGTLSIPVTQSVNGQTVSANDVVVLNGSYTTADTGLQIVSREVNYGASATGVSAGTRTYTLNNLSGKALHVSLQLPRQFPLAATAPCNVLATGASCSFAVSYVPATAGAATGTVFAQGVSDDGSTHAQTLAYMIGYGSGTGALTITGNLIPNAPLSFGQVISGQTAQRTLTLTNNGSGPLNVRRVSSAPPFLATTTCGVALAAGASCQVTVTYTPIDEVATGTSSGGTRNDAGVLTIESDAATSPSFVTLSGLAQAVASGSPASSAVLTSYELSQSALTFGNTQVGNASGAQTTTLTNTGTATIHVLGLLPPSDFTAASTCGTVLPGASCDVSVTFSPGGGTGTAVRTGTLEIQSDATDALEYVSLIGSASAAPISLSATTLSFGIVSVGVTVSQSLTVTNTSGAPIALTGLSTNGNYSVATGSCPSVGGTIAAGATCTLTVTFSPTTSGPSVGTLSVATDATQLPLTVALTGTATAPQLQVSPGSLSFGSVAVGGSSQLTLTLTNVGTASLTGIAQSIAGVNDGDFAVTVQCGVTALAPGQGCAETLTFMPGASGARSGTLTVFSSDPGGSVVVAMSGSGVVTPTPSFTLTVNGGSSATVTVASGSSANYPLTVTPVNGYSGGVALTCVALTAGLHASCSLSSPLLTLGGTQSTTATISTLSAAFVRGVGGTAWLLAVPLLLLRKRRPARLTLFAVVGLALCVGTTSCGKGSGLPTTPTVFYTPAGTYQYQVTASSTSGTQVSATLTLNLIVQ